VDLAFRDLRLERKWMQRACRWGTLLEEGSRACGEERGERMLTRGAMGEREGLGGESCDDWEWEWWGN
jgi:hypothetical protein